MFDRSDRFGCGMCPVAIKIDGVWAKMSNLRNKEARGTLSGPHGDVILSN